MKDLRDLKDLTIHDVYLVVGDGARDGKRVPVHLRRVETRSPMLAHLRPEAGSYLRLIDS